MNSNRLGAWLTNPVRYENFKDVIVDQDWGGSRIFQMEPKIQANFSTSVTTWGSDEGSPGMILFIY